MMRVNTMRKETTKKSLLWPEYRGWTYVFGFKISTRNHLWVSGYALLEISLYKSISIFWNGYL